MEYLPIRDRGVFCILLNDYYREGEDAATPQEDIDGFLTLLWDLLEKGIISGCILWDKEPLGFALWQIDSKESPFAQHLGWGTILEIGIVPAHRGKGYGGELVRHAEIAMDAKQNYVCAYGPAEAFWQRCGYCDSGETAENGLKLFVK